MNVIELLNELEAANNKLYSIMKMETSSEASSFRDISDYSSYLNDSISTLDEIGTKINDDFISLLKAINERSVILSETLVKSHFSINEPIELLNYVSELVLNYKELQPKLVEEIRYIKKKSVVKQVPSFLQRLFGNKS